MWPCRGPSGSGCWCRAMSRCNTCGDVGIVLICYHKSQDYDAAACRCPAGRFFRTRWQLKAWAAQQTPPPVRIGRLEEFYTERALAVLETEDGPSIAEMFGAAKARA